MSKTLLANAYVEKLAFYKGNIFFPGSLGLGLKNQALNLKLT